MDVGDAEVRRRDAARLGLGVDPWMRRSGGAVVGWVDAADAAVQRSCVDCRATAAAAWTAC